MADAISFLRRTGAWLSRLAKARPNRGLRRLRSRSFARPIGRRFTVSCATADTPWKMRKISHRAFSLTCSKNRADEFRNDFLRA